MTLGMLVSTDRHKDHALGLTKAALKKGHQVIIFNMDAGTKLLEDEEFLALSGLEGVTMSFCDHSAQYSGVTKDKIPADVPGGTQYNNATMMADADKVINL